ncbi:membrane protein [Microbacterium phage IAmGroot]|uniref:Membrane protein n=1 Tax=Microbacterium phage IAmGroot TaxID=2588486 RepID=A0A4Y6E8Y7_9CAUD|nr:membrane protein [Microbacterium phage IAmGroot]
MSASISSRMELADALAALSKATAPKPSKAEKAGVAIAIVLVVTLGLALTVGVPVAIGLAVFSALGFTGWGLTALTVGVVILWNAVIGALTRKR